MEHIDSNWFTDILIQLSHHNDSDIRIAVIEASIDLEYLIDKEILKNDSDIDVLNLIEVLQEKMK